MANRVHPNDAMKLVLRRLKAHGIDAKQDQDGAGRWGSGCPAHDGARTGPVLSWKQNPDGTVTVGSHRRAGQIVCEAPAILAALAIDDPRVRGANGYKLTSAATTERKMNLRPADNTGPFAKPARGGTDSYEILEKLRAALQEYDDGRGRTDRYACPACGAKGDGHGLRISHQDVPGKRKILLICDTNRCPVDEILKPLGMTPADICADDDVDQLGEDNPTPEQQQRENYTDLLARLLDGATFVLDAPSAVPCLWGTGNEVIWAEGESLMLAAPPGVGKTTLAGQVVRARVLGGTVLGHDVVATSSRVLYLAMDRPSQIARSLRRHFTDADRAALGDRLVVWKGPPPADFAKFPATLAGLADLAGADTVVIDSLKDAALGLTEDDVGAAYNRARQAALVAGVQLIELHHLVKRGPNGARPTTLADVYGSAWLTAGAGSVVLLWGAGGDPIVEWHHLKQPAEEVGPYRLIHDHTAGVTDVWHATDLLSIAVASGSHGVTVAAAASALFDTDKPNRNQVEKARRRLEALARDGHLVARDGQPAGRGGTPQKVYFPAVMGLASQSRTSHGTLPTPGQSRPPVPVTGEDETAGQTVTAAATPVTRQEQSRSRPPLEGGVRAPGTEEQEAFDPWPDTFDPHTQGALAQETQ